MNIRQLSPRNSLFGRIFIWFWLTTLVMLGSGVLIARLMMSNVSLDEVDEMQLQRVLVQADRIKRRLAQGQSIQQAINRNQRTRILVVAYSPGERQPVLNFPKRLLREWDVFGSLLDESKPWDIKLHNSHFIGPIEVVNNNRIYQIYAGNLLPREQIEDGYDISIIVIIVALCLSALFCIVLVSSLTKPISSLRQATKKITAGDLAARIPGLSHRKDEIGQLAQDFNQMADRVQLLVTSQQQLLANVSHELRSPLTRLQLAVALLDGSTDNATKAQNTQRIDKEIKEIDRLIDQLLTLAKVDSQATIQLQENTLAALLEPLIDDAIFEASTMSKRVLVRSLPTINIAAQRELFNSAIDNILRNALRFATQNVTVEANTASCDGHPGVNIVISDDGAGVADNALQHLFEPFYRAHNQVPTYNGAGLGLAIAASAIEHHGGHCRAERAQPSGLCIVIWLPLLND